MFGATRSTLTSVFDPGATERTSTAAGPPSGSPETKANCVSDSHVQVPELRTRHILVKVAPGAISVSSGIVTSAA